MKGRDTARHMEELEKMNEDQINIDALQPLMCSYLFVNYEEVYGAIAERNSFEMDPPPELSVQTNKSLCETIVADVIIVANPYGQTRRIVITVPHARMDDDGDPLPLVSKLIKNIELSRYAMNDKVDVWAIAFIDYPTNNQIAALYCMDIECIFIEPSLLDAFREGALEGAKEKQWVVEI